MKTIIEMAKLCDLNRVCGPLDTLLDDEWESLHRFATLVKAAHTAELLDGVEMPEPDLPPGQSPVDWDCGYYTADQLRETVAAAVLRKDAEIAELFYVVAFIERWANHHAPKPHMTAEQALSVIQHHPSIKAITHKYADGRVPETHNPYTERDALKAELAQRDAHIVEYNTRIQAEVLKLLNEKDALKAENERLRADAARYQWLRTHPVFMGWEHDYRADEVDAAIAAAMKGQP